MISQQIYFLFTISLACHGNVSTVASFARFEISVQRVIQIQLEKFHSHGIDPFVEWTMNTYVLHMGHAEQQKKGGKDAK